MPPSVAQSDYRRTLHKQQRNRAEPLRQRVFRRVLHKQHASVIRMIFASACFCLMFPVGSKFASLQRSLSAKPLSPRGQCPANRIGRPNRCQSGSSAPARDHAAPHGRGRRQASSLHRGEKRLDFRLDGLRQKLPRTSAKDISQWIVDRVGLTKGNNIASLVHGVSLSLRGSGRLDTRLDTPPISGRHHPLSRIARANLCNWRWLNPSLLGALRLARGGANSGQTAGSIDDGALNS